MANTEEGLEVTIKEEPSDLEGTQLAALFEEQEGQEEKHDLSTPSGPKDKSLQARFNSVYGKMKGYERQLAENTEKLKIFDEQSKAYKALLDHNQQLSAAIDKLSGTITDAQAHKAEGDKADALGKLETRIKTLRIDIKTAETEEDYELVAELEEKLADLRDEKRALKNPPKEEVAKVPSYGNPAIEKFVKENPWFLRDPKMNAVAVAEETKIKLDPDFKDKSEDEIYSEVAKRTKAFFKIEEPKKEDTETKKADNVGVETGSFTVGGGKPITVKLTPDEVEAAKFLKMDPADYAKQKLFLQKAGKKI